jgi:hypothetical protein
MATIKSYTDIEQSRKLAEILPTESADMKWYFWKDEIDAPKTPTFGYSKTAAESYKDTEAVYLSCWSLTALLDVLSEIKPQVYTPILFPSEGKWILQFAEYGHGNVCEVTCDNPVDACYEMIIRLKELGL